MKIAKKMLITMILIMIIFLAILFIVVISLTRSGFSKLEQDAATKDVQIAEDTLKDDIKSLDTSIRDNSNWDDAYNYVQGKNPDFVDTYFDAGSLSRINIHVLVIYDENGTILINRLVNVDNITSYNMSDKDRIFFEDNRNKFQPIGTNQSINGIIVLDEGPIIFAARPVLTTNAEGPIKGTNLMGRFVDNMEIERISKISHLNISIGTLGNLSFDEERKYTMKSSAGGERRIWIRTIDEQEIQGKRIINDFTGNPTLVLTVYSERTIHKIGETLIFMFIKLGVILCVLGIACFSYVLYYVFIRRLTMLEKQIMAVAKGKDTSRRIDIKGDDDITKLAEMFNSIIDALEKATIIEQKVFQAIPDLYFHIDREGNVLDYKGSTNHRNESDKDKSKRLDNFFPREVCELLINSAKKSHEINSTISVEFSDTTRKKGEARYYEAWLINLANNETSIVIKDVTASKKDQEYIRTRNEELEKTRIASLNIMEDLAETNKHLKELDEAKTNFLNMASHELKTPLTAISAYLEILEDYKGQFTPEQQQGIDAIQRNSKQLRDLINNILEISRMESGRFELNQTEINTNEKIKAIVDNLRVLTNNKGLDLKLEMENLPNITTDEMRFEEILDNLVGNAIKFTDKGSVTVKVEAEDDKIKISVIDTGIGVPDDKKGGLFQNFYQVDSTLSRKYGGTGLGLAITKKLIEAQRGNIDVISAPGKGSTFTFTLPIIQKKRKV